MEIKHVPHHGKDISKGNISDVCKNWLTGYGLLDWANDAIDGVVEIGNAIFDAFESMHEAYCIAISLEAFSCGTIKSHNLASTYIAIHIYLPIDSGTSKHVSRTDSVGAECLTDNLLSVFTF